MSPLAPHGCVGLLGSSSGGAKRPQKTSCFLAEAISNFNTCNCTRISWIPFLDKTHKNLRFPGNAKGVLERAVTNCQVQQRLTHSYTHDTKSKIPRSTLKKSTLFVPKPHARHSELQVRQESPHVLVFWLRHDF